MAQPEGADKLSTTSNALPVVGELLPTTGATPDVGITPSATGILRRLLSRPTVCIAVVFVIVIVTLAVFAPLVTTQSFTFQDLSNKFGGPSGKHWLGTDQLGRDEYTRLIYGARVSLSVSFIVVALAVAIAVPIGLSVGYFGGRIDAIAMRLVDIGLAIPPLLLALVLAAIFGPGTLNMSLALIIVLVPGLVRLVRGQAIAVREESFVEASRSIGTSPWRIMWGRVFRSAISPVIVQASLLMGLVMIVEASLSYLGLGVRPPQPSWGNMLRDGYDNALFTDPALLIIPGLAIMLPVMAFNSIGDGLRDALKPARSHAAKKPKRTSLGITAVERASSPATPRDTTNPAVLSIEGLTVEFSTPSGPARVIEDVSLSIAPGEILGLVGESGSGKTVTALSILRLLPSPPARIVSGSIWVGDRDILTLPFEEVRKLRGGHVGVVFQDPMSSLDPAFTIGDQLVEAQRLHKGISRKDARARGRELLELVRIPLAHERLDSFPHEISGGQRQRVMLALALANDPKLLIADEPTTALDVTTQAQILDIIRDLRRELGLAVLFVTHDLGVVAELCDRAAVMYAGQVVEQGDVADLFDNPRHPYTQRLLAAMPQAATSSQRLITIPGSVPSAQNFPHGCRFAPRCELAEAACTVAPVALEFLGVRGSVRCIKANTDSRVTV
jgi:peptide/nickel transport system permease protein